MNLALREASDQYRENHLVEWHTCPVWTLLGCHWNTDDTHYTGTARDQYGGCFRAVEYILTIYP